MRKINRDPGPKRFFADIVPYESCNETAKMTDIQQHLLKLNIFKSFIKDKRGSLAINDRAQVVVATSNVVKTTIATANQNYYKVLKGDRTEFEFNDVSFNHKDNLVALVGDRSITICDTKPKPLYNGRSSDWDTFSFNIGPFESSVKAVHWHPMSSEGSVIVVLTETELLLYDVVVSFQKPLVTLKLLNYPKLKNEKVSSVAFGSKHNLAGMITLYLLTESGSVFAIAPLVHGTLKITATKNQITQFAYETKTLLKELRDSFPPSVVLENSQYAALSRQCSFAEALEAQVQLPHLRSLSGEEMLSVSCKGQDLGYELQGPLIQVAPGSKLLQVSSNESFSLLATVHSASSRAVFTYVAQLHPLVMGWKNEKSKLAPPAKPVRQQLVEKGRPYRRPSKGFGYFIDSESEEDDGEAEWKTKNASYEEQLDLYRLKLKLHERLNSETQKLTAVATDETLFTYRPSDQIYFKQAPGSRFLWAGCGQLVVADLDDTVRSLLADNKFEPKYSTFKVSQTATGFSLYNDKLGCLGEYAIAYSPSDPVEVFKLKDKSGKKLKKSLETVKRPTEVPQDDVETGFSPEEISMIIGSKQSKPLPQVTQFDPKDIGMLTQVNELSKSLAERTSDFTKYLLAIQQKIQTQVEVLRFQADNLNQLRNVKGDTEKFQKNNEKVEKLVGRQTELFEKTERIRENVLSRLDAARQAQSLPISNAEKSWFKELNHMISILNNDKSESLTSLALQIEDLKQKVTKMSTGVLTESDKANNSIEQLALGNELVRISRLLKAEEKEISTLRSKVDSCHQLLQARAI